jgi:hypothetical protein
VREFKSGVKIGQTTVSPNVTLTPGWQLVSVEHTVQQSGSTLDLVVFDQPVAQNERLVIDNVSIRPPGATTGVEDLLAGATSFSTRVAPNPFRTRTRIAFTMPRPGRAKIEVVDLSGRLIRTLMDEAEISVGIHGVDFDGCDAQGARLPSGIYFYRVSSTAGSATQRFVLLK